MNSGHSSDVTSSSNQHYCLRWNNHHHNLLGVLNNVLSSQQHADVSLFCEGQVIRVHKLVLLASSSHFERILEASPAGQQPVIILDGTRYTDLRALVDYMYKGEVNIQQEQLSSLLKTADNLKLKGLADVANKEDDRGGGSRNGSGGGGTNGNLGTVEHSREGSSGMTISPPPMKRPKQSPVDPCSLNREMRDARELRDSREHLPTEPRDLSRDAPRDLSRDISHFGFSNANGNYHLSRRAYSPTHSISTSSNIASARSLLYSSSLITRQSSKSPVTNISSPYFTGSLVRPRSPHNQFDPTPGSSLHPPRTSPQSPVPDHKIVPQIICHPLVYHSLFQCCTNPRKYLIDHLTNCFRPITTFHVMTEKKTIFRRLGLLEELI
ncbi:Protein bric-a-brac 2 [Armadillidium nasatum]|uniref:Protein bric-a-brac 2 n=1 Tax=Armadillidium nasatum TaxID=96803 RepID=A0A5N5THM3_9CRUS|nr:Protein bric-a-brac 2 [Armadillidium nasatum]